MSVIEISPDLVEVTTLVLQPSQSFSSSSLGMQGAIRIYSKPTNSLKSFSGISSTNAYTETSGVTEDDDLLYNASQQYISGATSIFKQMDAYIRNVSTADVSSRQFIQTFPVRMFSPPSVTPTTFTDSDGDGEVDSDSVPQDRSEWTNFQRRNISKFLMLEQRTQNHLSFNAYVNYNSLNFVSSSNFGTSSALIFPNFPDANGTRDYTPDGPFTLDFFIKPRAPIDEIEHFRAGTVFHISSSICVSLVSGSSLASDRKPDKFRILLQLSQSADIPPSQIHLGSLPASSPLDLAFVTPEFLQRDKWSRVTIRWGAKNRNFGTGSIRVDNNITNFSSRTDSIKTGLNSNAVVIGNYYDSGDRIAKFFNSNASLKYGTLEDPIPGTNDPAGFSFSNPLNAEVHHISLFKRFLTDSEITNINDLFVETPGAKGPAFFLPPFFTSSIPSDGVTTYITPNVLATVDTDSPVSYQLALGYNSTFVNLQNFVVDFARSRQSRAYNMSDGVAVPTAFDSRDGTIDQLLMLQRQNRARNFFILPCDDGFFEPSFEILDSDNSRFQNIGASKSTMLISMDALAPPGEISEGGVYIRGAEFSDFSYDGSDSPYLPLYQNISYGTVGLPDNSSNRMLVFTIPSLYYMSRIIPESFVLTDSNISYSGGISMTLKDDGRGNIYRCDAVSKPAKWNRVGAIFYNHGIVALISPHLSFFGRNSYEMSFRGEMRKTIANFSVPAPPSAFNKSQNPTWQSFPPTNLKSEQAKEFNYISGINLHDDNFNVVMRARLAQVVQKREGDEIVFRIRYDF
jgi:hypothetical protein